MSWSSLHLSEVSQSSLSRLLHRASAFCWGLRANRAQHEILETRDGSDMIPLKSYLQPPTEVSGQGRPGFLKAATGAR